MSGAISPPYTYASSTGRTLSFTFAATLR